MYIIQCNNQTAFIASASLQDRSYGLIDFEFTSIKNKNMYEYLFTNKNGCQFSRYNTYCKLLF